MEFDYIIIGAGSAGCVLANRLSADPDVRVLLLEAGGDDDWIWFHIPVGYLFAIGNPRSDWLFRTEPSPGLGGRALNYPRGKVIGGSSAINAMIYMRGQAADYDGWRELGLRGWGWEDVLPHFMRHEDHCEPREGVHAAGGEWRVERPRMRWKILDRFARAAAEAGIPEVSDFNTGDNFGAGYFQVNQKRGVRWSAARGFLKPVLGRRNLRVETGATVERVVFDGLRASGVVWRKAGRREHAQCRGETILSAGAVQTPKLLELSGIGDGRRLSDLGIPIVRHLAGVGENLQDHLQLRPVFAVSGDPTLNELYARVWRRPLMALEYALFRRGPMTMAPSQMGAFAFSGPGKTRPDLQFHVQPLSLDAFGEPLHRTPAITVSVCNLRPSSRGGCHAISPDPQAPPAIDPNYLSSPDDIGVAVASLRLARRIMSMPALAAAAPREVRPGPDHVSEEALALAARDIATTIFHPVGTARMGVSGDPHAVTDDRLRVVGVTGLRVIDASVMPRITSGNTNAPTLMIAEKGASMLIEDARA